MTLQADIAAILEADDDLMDILTGGVWSDASEINRQATPGAFSDGEILPCCLVKVTNENSVQNVIRAVQSSLTLYFYQRAGYDQIGQALARAHTLLEMTHHAASQVWQVRFETEIAQTRDDALDCSLAVQRYNVIRKRS